MKTTVEIPDALLREAKGLAEKRAITLRQLIEDGLRLALDREQAERKPFKLRDGSVKLGPMKVTNWPEIRAIIYEGRGE